MGQFYTLMQDDSVQRIELSAEMEKEMEDLFVNHAGRAFLPDGIEEDLFNGELCAEEGVNVLFAPFTLPDSFRNIPNNQADISVFSMQNGIPKSIFWYQDGIFYFQIFSIRNILDRKVVLKLIQGNEYGKLRESAFIVDNKIQCEYKDGKLYFYHFNQAKMIFDLTNLFAEATDRDIKQFCEQGCLSVDGDKLKKIANKKTRKLLTLLSKTNNIESFLSKSVRKKNELIKKHKVNIFFDKNQKLVLPTNKVADLNRALQFLNEDIFVGEISQKNYQTNSKKEDK